MDHDVRQDRGRPGARAPSPAGGRGVASMNIPGRLRGPEIDLVKDRVDIVEVVREVVGDLQRRGDNSLWACCPFHDEDSPSFHVRPQERAFKCFGCGEGGDVFTFVMRARGIGFREALELLAQRAGVELAALSPEDRRRAELARRSRDVLEAARALFRRGLQAAPGNPAAEYMRARGFSDETLERFDIGFIPPDFLGRLRAARLEQAAIDGAGFTSAFSGRVAFGIRDGNGGLVGFGARRLSEEAFGPKYVNTRETAWFSKGRLLYGLDKAARTLARTRRLVVMEGYTDVMMAHQRGLDEAVATMGTAFTAEHLRLVKARVSDLVLVFDSDDAGRLAAERTVRMVLKEGMECRVLHVPDGKDPCDWFGTRGREDFDALLARDGRSGVDFLCRRGLERRDLQQPGLREEVAREVLALAAGLADPLRRESMVADVARACGLPRASLERSAAARAPVVPRVVRVGSSSVRVNALQRSQLAAVAGLAADELRLAVVRDLRRCGALVLPRALALLDLAEELAAEGRGRIDATEWLEAAGARDPELRAALDAALAPAPGSLAPTWEDAVEHLRRHHAEQSARSAWRDELRRGDLATNDAALRAVDALLRRRLDGGDAVARGDAP